MRGSSMTNQEILRTAMRQSAVDLNCDPADFLQSGNKIVYSGKNPAARRYLELPFSCDLVSYGNNIVASVSPQTEALVRNYIGKYPVEHCFETPNLHVLQEALAPYGEKICFMAEYFLPDMEKLCALDCAFELRMLGQEDFAELYVPQWSNALCMDRKRPDVLGIGAYEGGRLVGLAACSADCDTMWQIGVDVLPGWRRRGIACALTSRLALAILERGRVPFYCAAWSNLKSVRNAIKSGFLPAWVEMTAKNGAFVDKMNGGGIAE